MILFRFETPGLAHYSYLVTSRRGGRAVVVDPRRDVECYLFTLEHLGLTLEAVVETHIHADYLSGARELATRTGAELLVSRHDRGERYRARWRDQDVGHGDRISLDEVSIEALHTPGHTPEHLAFVVRDGRDAPSALLSGDFLFVGSVGRPDLLGPDSTRDLASRMYDSLQSTLPSLPDDVSVCPAHGAGSLCGSALGGAPISTLGAERAANPYLDPGLTRDAFVHRLLSDLPVRPRYYDRMKRLNAAGPPLAERRRPERLDVGDVARWLAHGAVALDVRPPGLYGEGHLPCSISLPGGGGISSWGALVVPYETPLVLVVGPDGREAADEAARLLRRVGLDDVLGYLAGGPPAWRAAGRPLRSTPDLSPDEIEAQTASGARVLDVRAGAEYAAGHIPGSDHIPAAELPARTAELGSRSRPVILCCRSGYRSMVAASLLERSGFTSLRNAAGGIIRWRLAGKPFARGT